MDVMVWVSHATLARQSEGRSPARLTWLVFVLQIGLIEALDAANDIVRGDLFPPSPGHAIDNARQVVRFETAHGFFLEPGWYQFFQHTHHLLGLTLTHQIAVGIANNVYAFFHIGVPIVVAAWVYARHRAYFALFRNVLIAVGIVALVGYLVYPVAPPRLTTGLLVHGHAFQFHNTMPYPKGAFLVNGRPLGYNPYAAMPSLHIAWASFMSLTIFLLSRNPVSRAFAAVYPWIMLVAVVVTANHYVLDGAGSLLTLAVAAPIAVAVTRITGGLPGPPLP